MPSETRLGNSAGSKLTIEYDSVVISADGTQAAISGPSVTFYSKSGWSDSSNVGRVRGGAVTDKTLFTNKTMNGGTDTWTPTPTWRDLSFTTTDKQWFIAEVAGISYYENDNSSDFYGPSLEVTYPLRPYAAPNAPTLGLTSTQVIIGGNQNTATTDKYWDDVLCAVETNDVWAAYSTLAGNSTAMSYAQVSNGRHRARAYAKNRSASGPVTTTGYVYTKPLAPGTPTATRVRGSTTVTVGWAVNAKYVGLHKVYRSLDGGAFVFVTDTGTNAYVDTVPLGSTASYYIVTYTPAGIGGTTAVSDKSANGTIDTGTGWNVPNAPGVTLQRTGTTTATIKITGNQNSAAADRYWANLDYQIQLNDGGWGGVVTLVGSVTSVALTGLLPDAKVKVQARAHNATGYSAWAPSGVIYTTVSAPTGLVFDRPDVASPQVLLHWTVTARWAGSTLVEKSLDGGAWTQVAVVVSGGTADLNQPVSEAAYYRLRTASPDGAVFSAYTAPVYVGYGFISHKDRYFFAGAQVDYMFVGTDRVRRALVGTVLVWEDGDGALDTGAGLDGGLSDESLVTILDGGAPTDTWPDFYDGGEP